MGRIPLKLILNGIVIIPLLMWFTEATFIGALLFALFLCIAAYIVGDQWILRKTNNTIATISDGIMAALLLWIAAVMFDWSLSFMELMAITITLAIVEIFYHRFLRHIPDSAR